MTIHKLLWDQPAVEVLYILRELATYPPASDPYPHAWPYARPGLRADPVSAVVRED